LVLLKEYHTVGWLVTASKYSQCIYIIYGP